LSVFAYGERLLRRVLRRVVEEEEEEDKGTEEVEEEKGHRGSGGDKGTEEVEEETRAPTEDLVTKLSVEVEVVQVGVPGERAC
jgi:hypothetical protein